jgi:DNA repair photolyase
MLGELYYPTGLAKETAQQVLEIENPMACNLAWGCPNMCSYCFVPYTKKGDVRFPKRDPRELVEMQLKSGICPEGVFLCFHTDPFVHCNNFKSVGLIDLLMGKKIRIATLSKVDAPISFNYKDMRIGMTIVSDSDDFSKKFEPNALPSTWRIAYLKCCHDWGYYTWVSLEPFPTPNIFKQDLTDLLEKISFVDFIIFGKWNYDKRANDRGFYKGAVEIFEKYCEDQGIRYFVKSETRNFIGKH